MTVPPEVPNALIQSAASNPVNFPKKGATTDLKADNNSSDVVCSEEITCNKSTAPLGCLPTSGTSSCHGPMMVLEKNVADSPELASGVPQAVP